MGFEGGRDRLAEEQSKMLELGLPIDFYDLPKAERARVVEKRIAEMRDKISKIDPNDPMANTKKKWFGGLLDQLVEIRDEIEKKSAGK